MKRVIINVIVFLVLSILVCTYANADTGEEWKTKPVITSLYECDKNKIYLEWDGNADLYRINIDGKEVDEVNINKATVTVKDGVHQITVIPLKKEAKDVDTSVEFNLFEAIGGKFDVGALGVDPTNNFQGTPSDTFRIDYTVSPVFDAKPAIKSAVTDFNDTVILEVTDKYDSDIYRIYIKSGKDTVYIDYDTSDSEAASLIQKEKSSVTIILDQDYLKKHECMIPELDQKYSFSVKLRKWPIDRVEGKKVIEEILESKESGAFEYTPIAAWRYAPEITYHSQTADGEITLKWEHADNNLGCEYKIIKLDKLLVVKKGEDILGTTKEKEFIIKDLMNGKYTFVVVPMLSGKEGEKSGEVTEEIQNNWVSAPTFICETIDDKTVLLKWPSVEGVVKYHVTVYAGSGSLLRFVNLDFKKYEEFDIAAEKDDIEYTYNYSGNTNDENEVKLKFEIYGIRYAADGTEQKSAVSTQTAIIN